MNIIKLENGWEDTRSGITKLIINLQGLKKSQMSPELLMMLHSKIYKRCFGKLHQFYSLYKDSIEDYIATSVMPCLKQKHEDGEHEFMLREFLQTWTHFRDDMCKWLTFIFEYLHRHSDLKSVRDFGLTCFKNMVYPKLKGQLRDAVSKLIQRGIRGEQIDGALLKNVLDCLVVDFGMDYEKEFDEQAMLDEAILLYYSPKASCWISELSEHEYLLKVEECLKGIEDSDLQSYLPSGLSKMKLLKTVANELLRVHALPMIDDEHSGCRALLRDDKMQDLSIMHRRCSLSDGVSHKLADIFKQHVIDQGNAFAVYSGKKANKIIDKALVRRAVEVHHKYLSYVSACFHNCTLFHKAFKEAFDVFCNKGHVFSPEILAAFCDNVLITKGGGSEKASNEAGVEEILEKVVKLIAYINDKDIFAEFYRKKLARRLLLPDTMADLDLERRVLTKLKQQFGGLYTYRMEAMLTDVALAREFQTSFEDYANNNPEVANTGGVDLSVTVLNTGLWPSYVTSDLSFPTEMVECLQAFSEFYQAKTKKRKLTWIHSLGTCNVKANFETKAIELIVTTYQAAVLLLFNSSDRLSYSEIRAQLHLNDGALTKVLHSLSCAKHKILNKEPAATKIISPTDYFEFNSKFTDKISRIKIPQSPVEDKQKVIEVDKDRRYAIDACLVRIMKKRKLAAHQQLVSECVEQLEKMFKPDIKVIKKRIEDLIQRDYLERDKENSNLLRYLA